MPDNLIDKHYLTAVVDGCLDAIICKDLDGKITVWNEAAERLFGWPASEIIGQSIRRLVPPDLEEEEDLILAQVRARCV